MKGFSKIQAYSVLVLSGIGVLVSISLYILGVTRIYEFPAKDKQSLFVGIFVVWLSTVTTANRLTKDFRPKDFCKAALRGCPPWMRIGLWVVIGGAFAVLFLPTLTGMGSGDSRHAFILFPIFFYVTSFCVTYSLINVESDNSMPRCLNGHALSPLTKFCDECGASAATETSIAIQSRLP